MAAERRTTLDLSNLLAGLEQPLQLIDNPERRQDLQAYATAARPHVERAAFDLLSQVVAAFNDAASDTRARLEYSNGLHLAVETGARETEPEPSFDDTDQERVTLRLPRELKDLIDSLASRRGMSANNWYVRELSRIIGRHVHDTVREEMRSAREEMRSQRRGFYRGRSSMKGFVGDE